MKVLMVITSHTNWVTLGERQDSGSKSSQHPTTFSRTPASRSRSHPRKAAVRHLIPRATSPHLKLISRAGSRRTRPRKLNWIRPFASTA
jgi:hypothetical protein